MRVEVEREAVAPAPGHRCIDGPRPVDDFSARGQATDEQRSILQALRVRRAGEAVGTIAEQSARIDIGARYGERGFPSESGVACGQVEIDALPTIARCKADCPVEPAAAKRQRSLCPALDEKQVAGDIGFGNQQPLDCDTGRSVLRRIEPQRSVEGSEQRAALGVDSETFLRGSDGEAHVLEARHRSCKDQFGSRRAALDPSLHGEGAVVGVLPASCQRRRAAGNRSVHCQGQLFRVHPQPVEVDCRPAARTDPTADANCGACEIGKRVVADRRDPRIQRRAEAPAGRQEVEIDQCCAASRADIVERQAVGADRPPYLVSSCLQIASQGEICRQPREGNPQVFPDQGAARKRQLTAPRAVDEPRVDQRIPGLDPGDFQR